MTKSIAYLLIPIHILYDLIDSYLLRRLNSLVFEFTTNALSFNISRGQKAVFTG